MVLLLALLAGCGGDSPGTSAAPTTADGVGEVTVAPDGAQEITLQVQDDYVFTPDHFTVDPGTVRLTVVSVAEQMTHNFTFTPDPVPRRSNRRSRSSRPGRRRPSTSTSRRPATIRSSAASTSVGAGRHDDGAGLIRCPSSTWS